MKTRKASFKKDDQVNELSIVGCGRVIGLLSYRVIGLLSSAAATTYCYKKDLTFTIF